MLVVDAGADEVGRHQVGGELDALELPADRRRPATSRPASWPGRARPRRSRWPPDSSATAIRSSSTSWPTMVRLTSNSTCSSGFGGASSSWSRPRCRRVGSCESSAVISVVRRPVPAAAAAERGADRDGEADAGERVVAAGSAMETTMPMTSPLALSSGPPELPGLTAASNWIRPENCAVVGLRGAVQARRRRRWWCCRSARAGCRWRRRAPPTATPPPRVAGTTGSGSVAGRQHGDVGPRVRRRDGGAGLRAVGEQDADRAAVGDHVVGGEDRAAAVAITPVPSAPFAVRTTATDGPTCWKMSLTLGLELVLGLAGALDTLAALAPSFRARRAPRP